MLNFRLATKEDVGILNDIRGKELTEFHLEHINNKSMEYIIAYDGKEPVSHIIIDYKCKNKWVHCPLLNNLEVKSDKRKKGYGRKIIEYAIKRVKDKGYKKASIEVETHEVWIKEFYEKMGFKKVSGPHTINYKIKDMGNKEFTEVVYHLVKNL